MKKWISLITPFNEDKSLDIASLEKYLTFITKYDFDGFLIAGSVGEGFLLSIEEIKTYIKIFRTISKKPIMLGAIDFNFERLNEKLKLDADYFLTTPPIYFKPHQEAIIKHFKSFAKLNKKIFLYNNPSRVSASITNEIYEAIYEENYIIGVKECDDANFAQRTKNFPKWEWLTGNDDFFIKDEFINNGNGIISTIGNIIPDIFEQNKLDNWEEFCNIAYAIPNPVAVKIILAKWGLIKPFFRAPFEPIPILKNEEGFNCIF